MISGLSSSLNSQKLLGKFYTPPPLAQALTNWAVQGPRCTVFDPSFGGCAFFSASLRSLKRAGAKNAGRLLYGVDVDPQARAFLDEVCGEGALPENFLTKDFLSVSPRDFPVSVFEAVVGNPPYVRHHLLKGLTPYQLSDNTNQIKLSGRASYWAHFVLHSLQFVAPRGRLALVLPGSFIYSDYAVSVREALSRAFRSVIVVAIEERLFCDAEETSVVLLAEGRGDVPHEFRVGRARNSEDLQTLVGCIKRRTRRMSSPTACARLSRALVDTEALTVFEGAIKSKSICTVGEVAQIKLGVVTGCNEVLLVSPEIYSRLGLRPNQAIPVVVHSQQLRGLRFTWRDHMALQEREKGLLLLDLDEDEALSRSTEAYLAAAERDGFQHRYKCRIRTPWYAIGEIAVHDAFLPSLSFRHTRIVPNRGRVACTNSIYGLNWRVRLNRRQEGGLALFSLSSLFQFGAEYRGRAYGGGVLKLEPGDAGAMPLLRPTVVTRVDGSVFLHADQLLRSGKFDEATEIVDKSLLVDQLGLTRGDVDRLKSAIVVLQKLRVGERATHAQQ